MAGVAERCTHVGTIAPLASTLPVAHRSDLSAADERTKDGAFTAFVLACACHRE
jgi:hypothetical protein